MYVAGWVHVREGECVEFWFEGAAGMPCKGLKESLPCQPFAEACVSKDGGRVWLDRYM